jgi:hypothetical protein
MTSPRRFPPPWSVEEQDETRYSKKSFAEQHGRTPMAGKGKRSKQRKKLVKKLAKKVIKKAKKAEKKSNSEVDRSDVKPPSPFSS